MRRKRARLITAALLAVALSGSAAGCAASTASASCAGTEVQLGECPQALGNIDSFLARVANNDPRVGEMTRLRELCKRGANLQLYHDIAQPAPDPMFTPAEPAPPITHRWWFWTAIGAAALAATGATIYVVTHDGTTTLPPIHCTGAGCMP